MSDQAQFLILLNALLSTDNNIRRQAEGTYEQFSIETKFQYLWTCLGEKNSPDVSTMAAVLLRKIIDRNFDDFFPKLSPEVQSQIKRQMLVLVQQEENVSMRKKWCEIISALARQQMDEDGNNMWPEFLEFLFEYGSSTEANKKEVALTLFSLYPGVFGNQQQQNLGLIKSMLSVALQNDAQSSNQILAVKATCSFVLLHAEEVAIQKSVSDLFPSMLSIIARNIENGDDDEILQSLVELADSCPKFIRPQVDAIYQLTIKALAPESNIEESVKHMLLEVIITLAETAPAMVRKTAAKYLGTLIPQMLHMMTDLEDEEDWSVSETQSEEDSDSNATVAESSLDRLACSLGGKAVLPHINATLTQMLQNENWKFRHAALMAISAVGEGCHKQMEAMLPQIMDAVIRYLQDPHPRVRYAACNAVGQMATDFSCSFQRKFHGIVVPGLLLVMDDTANPRVQAHAGAALVNFSEVCPKDILTKYLATIIGKLESVLVAKFRELMERGTKLVLEQVVTTIASVADAAEENFLEYYDRFMPCLMYIIENANSRELSVLRGKTIECASLIGLAVGADKFFDDACKMMDLMLQAQSSEEISDDDPQMSYLISAWARVCKIMGRRFERYLPLVMPPILKSASLKPEVAVLDNDDLTAIEEDDAWQFVSLGDNQNFGIRTGGLMEKATACQMLVCYAKELKEGFAAYTEETVKLMVPHLKFYLHEDVRTAAAESLPCLLECAKFKGQQYLGEMWQYICPELMKAIESEPEMEIISEFMFSFAKCVEVLGNGCLSEEQMQELLRILNNSLKDHFVRSEKRIEKRKDEDYDEVVEEELVDEDKEDTYILSKIGEIIHSLFAAYRQQFFPYFEALLPHFIQLLDPVRSWSDHQYGLCIFDDVIEFGGPQCAKYTEHFLQPMLRHISDKKPEVRQASAYGFGVLAQHGGPEFAPVFAQAIPLLIQIVQDSQSRSDTNINPTENAISAVTKILKYNNSGINVDEVLPLWLSWLPVWEDIDEAPYVYGYLCDLIDANNQTILGADNSNLPKVMIIIAEAFNKEAVEKEDEITKRMLNIVRQVQTNQNMFQACINQLSTEQQLAIHKFMT